MSKSHQKNLERQLIDVVNSRGNDNKCGDCGSGYPTWASYSLGILLCGRCAAVHRRILPERLAHVKSLTLEHWTSEQIERLRRVGNKKSNRKWNSRHEPFPYDEDDTSEIEQFIRDKYVLGKFRDSPIGTDDEGFEPESRPSLRRLRLSSVRLNSARQVSDIPRLTHRKLTTFESTQYMRQANTIATMGYSDKDAVKEALILGNGDIDFALDILNEDSKVNPAKEEIAPSLPRRPAALSNASSTGTFLSNNPMVQQQTSAPSEWWTGSSNVTANATGVAQPQIYQYTDPVTGQVSYIDANGQEYLDPSNPQHQQLLYQQQNPQLVAQQTNKQQIMSLYSQPDSFSSNVAVPADPLKPQQQPTQQQAPQFQQFQQYQQQQQPQQVQPQYTQYQQPTFQQGANQQQAFINQPTGLGFQQPFGQQYR